jgi:Domain of unknown function (DUF4412)
MSTTTRIAITALGAALLATPLAAQGFEGVVSYKMIGGDNGKGMETTMSIKGTQIRTDMAMGGHSAAMLMDGEAQVMTMLIPDQKMYMTMDMKKVAEKAQGMEQKEHTPPKITALGTSETIAGRTCQNFLIETDKSKMEVCNAKGMGNFMSPRNPMGRGPTNGLNDLNSEAYRSFFKDGFFPLRVTSLKDDKRQVMMEATRVEPKSLDPSLFTVPTGFTEMKMPGMGPR